MLGTIAYAIVGLGIIMFRKKRALQTEVHIDSDKLSRDQLWFISIFIFKVLLGLVMFSIKPLLGCMFLVAYGLYFMKEMRAEAANEDLTLVPLKFQPQTADPATSWVLGQTFLALILIFGSSHLFVKNLELVSQYWQVSPVIVSLLLSPIATELPEIINALIWVRQGKEQLAFGNISGAMMIQATVPSAFGLFFTPWLFDIHLLWAGIVTLLSVSYLWLTLKQEKLSPIRLVYASAFYILFAAIFLVY